jgi:hypothetical protein
MHGTVWKKPENGWPESPFPRGSGDKITVPTPTREKVRRREEEIQEDPRIKRYRTPVTAADLAVFFPARR